jgi:hypothetical protein
MDYMIRVELHKASEVHYQRLHSVLAAKGVTNTIRADDGSTYKLPPAEYTYSGNESVTAVRDAVGSLAATVLPNPAVVVTQRVGCAWTGLKPS